MITVYAGSISAFEIDVFLADKNRNGVRCREPVRLFMHLIHRGPLYGSVDYSAVKSSRGYRDRV